MLYRYRYKELYIVSVYEYKFALPNAVELLLHFQYCRKSLHFLDLIFTAPIMQNYLVTAINSLSKVVVFFVLCLIAKLINYNNIPYSMNMNKCFFSKRGEIKFKISYSD